MAAYNRSLSNIHIPSTHSSSQPGGPLPIIHCVALIELGLS